MTPRAQPPRVAPARLMVSLLAVLAVLPLAGCGGKPSPRPVAEHFLADVARGDFVAAAKLADVPAATIRTAYRSFLDPLAATGVALRLGAVTTAGDGATATATFHATVAPGGFATFDYDGSLPLAFASDAWRVRWATTVVHPALTAGRHVAVQRTFGPRAPILDGAGHVLVRTGAVVTVGVHPRLLRDRAAELTRLGRLLGVSRTDLAQRVAAARPDDFVPVLTLRRAAFERLRPALDRLAGVPYRAGTAPLAPTPTFARALLGRVGDATADALHRLGPPYRAGDQVGLYGIQAGFERRLAGTPSAKVLVEDAKGSVVQTLATLPGRRGQPVRLTIDPRVQRAAEQALGDPTAASPHASLVAVRATTGEVLAVANRPGESSYDTALVGRYPPGSTFKVVTTTALLSGGLRVDDPVACPPTATVSGKVFHNFQGETADGAVPFRTDFAISCNTAFVGLSQRLRDGALTSAAAAYGIGGAWRLSVPAFTGSVPSAADAVERAAQAIGQGQVLVSPLAMAVMAATVDSGTWHPPQLVTDPAPAARPSPHDLPPDVAGALRSLMRSVVTSGTARQAFAGFPAGGPPVYGKTGTAEFGTANPPQTHAWFVGFRGDVAFAVLVEGGGVGGQVAAPIAARFLRTLGTG